MSFRRFLKRTHLTIGLAAGVWLAILGLSGAILVFGRELDRWVRPELLCVTPAERHVTWDELADTVRRYAPEEPLFRIRLPQRADESAEFWLTSVNGRRVYIDHYTGRILGDAGADDSFVGFVRRLHVELLMGKFGRTFVGVCGLCLAIICITGLRLWWPGRRGLRQVLRRPASSASHVRLHWQHRSLGAVVALPLLLTAVTGAALVFDDTARHITSFATQLPPAASPPDGNETQSGTRRETKLASVDQAIRVAADALSNATTTWIWLPTKSNSALTVRLKTPGEWHPNGRNFVYLDAATLQVRGIVDVRHAQDVTLVTNQFYPLHVGSYGGVGTRWFVATCGLAPAMLLITATGGVWLRKQRRK